MFFDYPPAIRRAINTTNAIESLNYSLRKVLKGRSAFPNDEAIFKVLYMGLQHGVYATFVQKLSLMYYTPN